MTDLADQIKRAMRSRGGMPLGAKEIAPALAELTNAYVDVRRALW